MRHLRQQVSANPWILSAAIALDAVVLTALLAVKASTDMLVIYAAVTGLIIIFIGERWFLRAHDRVG
jgi:hypothetical protein